MDLTNIHDKLSAAVIEYDRKELARHLKNPNRAYHNPNAIGHYLNAVAGVMEELQNDTVLREALVNHFTGRLLDKVLKAVGEVKSTDAEQRMRLF